MNIQDALWHVGFPLLARLNDVFDLSLDTWFKIAAVAILWLYVLVGPGRDRERAEF